MSSERAILTQAASLMGEGVPFVLVTVASTQGSSPRSAGAKMIWKPNDEILGSIGGGELEHLARDAARTHLENSETGVERFVLGADADQCCGGTVDLLFECFGARTRVVLFGAGHVSREIVRCLDDAPVEIVVVDERPEWNSAERFGGGCRREMNPECGVEIAQENPGSTLTCVLTHSHDLDFDILRGLLADPAKAPAYVGLIGSKSKRACFFTRLSGSGIDQPMIDRVTCPMGLGDMGKAPGLVAVSIVGELLIKAKEISRA
ncbi:MAG: xanthine dehydrogenase accessory factor [Phycisphaerales bacterium]|jgi:xanthine dehydrogenase accessory factor